MNVQALQLFLSGNLVPGAAAPVDLLKVAKAFSHKQRNRPLVGKGSANKSHFRLVLDAECCLDRLYGGYFSDWACGGQWNRMINFLALLNQATEGVGLELVIFFNGSLENSRRAEWIQHQLETRLKINNVLKHVATKGTPPPKIWWVPPACLKTSLKMAFRHLNTVVINSTDDHHQEVIAYCRENSFHGLIADDAEYAVFNPPRHFSSQQLKLTYKGTLETKEYSIQEVLKALDLPTDRLCILAALLGNHILTSQDLADFYKKINLNTNKVNIDQTVRTIANFVKDLPSSELDIVAQKIFDSLSDPKCSLFKQSVQYFINGTKDGFILKKTSTPSKAIDSTQSDQNQTSQSNAASNTEDDSNNLKTTGFASETAESEQESLNAYKEATANAAASPQIVIEASTIQTQGDSDSVPTEEEQSPAVNGTHNLVSPSSSSSNSGATSPSHVQVDSSKSKEKPAVPPSVPEVSRTALERHKKGLMSPYIHQILTTGEIKLPVLMEDENHKEFPSIHVIYRPVRQMIYAILFNLHHRLYMATKSKEKGEIEKVEIPDIIVKEWIWSKTNPYTTPEPVKAEQVGWGIPTIQRLWFGTGIDDKRRRLRAFLTCMKSDTQGMLSIGCVPQHLLILACVLRYIMTFSDKIKILRRQELDAFIVQALSPELMNAQYLQDLQLSLVTTRGIQLASLFMAGVEVALLANDACGAPIPWLMCCPWLYFDGKLFHHVLARAAIAKNLLDLCNGQIDRVVKVERMRKVILEGFNPIFARSPLPVPAGVAARGVSAGLFPPAGLAMQGGLAPVPDHQRRGNLVGAAQGPPPLYYAAAAAGALGPLGGGEMPGPGGARGGLMRRAVPARGGQLEIAGVVVGQWGPNYGRLGPQHQGVGCAGPQAGLGGAAPHRSRLPPQVTSVGGVKFSTSRNYGNQIGNRATYSAARGNTRSSPGAAGRGKKMQMKAGMKKKTAYKKSRDSERRTNPGKGVIDGVNSGLSNTFANLTLSKATLRMPGQYNNPVENGRGGQGDAIISAHLTKRH